MGMPKMPAMPEPVATPAPQVIIQQDEGIDPQIAKDQEEQRKKRLKVLQGAKGRRATILTSGTGASDDTEDTVKQSLLGGAK